MVTKDSKQLKVTMLAMPRFGEKGGYKTRKNSSRVTDKNVCRADVSEHAEQNMLIFYWIENHM